MIDETINKKLLEPGLWEDLRDVKQMVWDLRHGFEIKPEDLTRIRNLAKRLERLPDDDEEVRKVYVAEGRKLKQKEGVLEIDENAKISIGDPTDGAYVEAWAWVSADEVYGTCEHCGKANIPGHDAECPIIQQLAEEAQHGE